MIKCQVVMDAMDRLAPRYLAEDWDNVGLLIGSPAQDIHKILTCLDVTENIIDTAIAQNYDMIISHHPFLFRGIKRIATDKPLGRMLQKLLSHNIAVFAAHTNLDTTFGGVNDVLAEKLNLTDLKPLTISYREEIVKLGVNVPAEFADKVREAIGRAGAGAIGNYKECSFQFSGQGRFTPLEGAAPFIGKQDKNETVNEVRIETIMPVKIKKRVIRAMLKAHPYEVPAYDIIPTQNVYNENGLGRIGKLQMPMDIMDFAKMAKQNLPGDTFRLVKSNDKPVQKVALCSGAGVEFLDKAAMQGADTYVTGDVKYHEAQHAQELGINLIDAGHFGTEMPIAQTLADYLQKENTENKWQIEITADTTAKDVFTTI